MPHAHAPRRSRPPSANTAYFLEESDPKKIVRTQRRPTAFSPRTFPCFPISSIFVEPPVALRRRAVRRFLRRLPDEVTTRSSSTGSLGRCPGDRRRRREPCRCCSHEASSARSAALASSGTAIRRGLRWYKGAPSMICGSKIRLVALKIVLLPWPLRLSCTGGAGHSTGSTHRRLMNGSAR